MNVRHWWLIPLAVALVVDAGLAVQHETTPAMAVNRAVSRTTSGGDCRESILFRGVGLNDQVDVMDAWNSQGQIFTQRAKVTFTSSTQLSAASVQALELNDALQPVIKSGGPTGRVTLAGSYHSQVRQGISWLGGPCVPLVNPFQSGIRPLGKVSTGSETYALYGGRITVNRGGGQPLFADAQVWMGVRPGGRLGFEVLHAVGPTPMGTLEDVATLYTYPTERMATVQQTETLGQLEQFYLAHYQRLLAMLHATVHPQASL